MSMIATEERKVIGVGQGKQSMHVVLPAFWCKFKDLKAGDTVAMVVTSRAVIVLPKDGSEKQFIEAFEKMGK